MKEEDMQWETEKEGRKKRSFRFVDRIYRGRIRVRRSDTRNSRKFNYQRRISQVS
jgi:hypothetical protein